MKMLKQMGYFLIIIILLPYIITVFVNGQGVTMGVDLTGSIPYVNVETDKSQKKISLEEYGIGVLAKEMTADSETDALKAQAVLIRTSIYKDIQEEGSEAVMTKGYWTRSQMKSNWGSGDYGENYEKMKAAWKDTDGEVLMYEGKLILTPYHKLSNGMTRSGNEVFSTEDYPYLKAKECPDDVESKDAMTTTMIGAEKAEIKKKDSAGYVSEVECDGESLSGEEFREKYHLTSASFTLQEYEGKIRVTTKGIGHGLGMSQYYANKMAKDGSDYQKILEYFFEGTSLETVAEIIME